MGDGKEWAKIDSGHAFELRNAGRMHHLILRPRENAEGFNDDSNYKLRMSVECSWDNEGGHLLASELLPFEMKVTLNPKP